MNQWTMDKPSDEQLGGIPHLQVGASRINPREIVTFCCQEAVEGMCGHAKTVEQGRPQGQNLRSVLSTLLLD